jgi:hypothetical protein
MDVAEKYEQIYLILAYFWLAAEILSAVLAQAFHVQVFSQNQSHSILFLFSSAVFQTENLFS